MELSDYIRVLRKNWLVIVVLTLVGLGIAALLAVASERPASVPVYSSPSEPAPGS